MNDENLLFFVRDPGSESVKSRLAAAVGREAARELYRCFLLDMAATLTRGDFSLAICVHPAEAVSAAKQFLGAQHHYRPQAGDDLGRNMREAFTEAFTAGYKRVVLIGSDLPDLPLDTLEKAFSLLRTVDCVIGPSADGGYYLIGFTSPSFVSEAFSRITWGSASVLADTIRCIEDHGRRIGYLPLGHDIDTLEDLRAFCLRSQGRSPALHTRGYLSRSRLLE